jgi:hypothetical protein
VGERWLDIDLFAPPRKALNESTCFRHHGEVWVARSSAVKYGWPVRPFVPFVELPLQETAHYIQICRRRVL